MQHARGQQKLNALIVIIRRLIEVMSHQMIHAFAINIIIKSQIKEIAMIAILLG